MARMTKKRGADMLEPYWYNPDIHLTYELQYRKEMITPGTFLKIKSERSVFRFDRLVSNAKTGKVWLDVYDTTLGGWRSFEVNKISSIYKVKRSRAKKQ